MDSYMDKKLGYHEPNMAYDLPEVLIRIRKLTKMADLEGLPTFLNNAQLMLDEVKKDVESHLLLLQCEIGRVREKLNDDDA